MTGQVNEVDELQYDWPTNVLRYESRHLFGLSVNDLLTAALPAAGLMILSPLLGLAVGAVGLLLMIRFEGLGDRRLLAYLVARLKHHFNRRPVVLSLIRPVLDAEVIFTDLDGVEIARFGGEGEHRSTETI
jgi:hypothetical protein